MWTVTFFDRTHYKDKNRYWQGVIEPVLYKYKEVFFRSEKDIITYYFNIIKKLYVETYYKLTNDRVIIDLINNSNFYNVNTISSKLFSNIVPSEKNKSKIKKKNF